MYVNFIVPTDVGETLVDDLRASIIDRWGGLTAIQGNGQWRSPSGEIVGEPSVDLGVDTGDAWVGDVDLWFYELACRLHADGRQHTVYYRIDGHGRFVTWANSNTATHTCPACGCRRRL
jgi:hypothetical protein